MLLLMMMCTALRDLMARCEIAVEGEGVSGSDEEPDSDEESVSDGASDKGVVVDINDLLTTEEPPGVP